MRVLAGRSICSFDGAAAQQHREQHQTGAVRRGHQERPECQVSEAHLHANPTRVVMPHQKIDPKTYQNSGDRVANRFPRQCHAKKRCGQDHAPDGQRVPQSDGDERLRHGASLPLLHSESHGEKPPHPRVNPMVGAEEQHQPQRRRARRRMRHCASE